MKPGTSTTGCSARATAERALGPPPATVADGARHVAPGLAHHAALAQHRGQRRTREALRMEERREGAHLQTVTGSTPVHALLRTPVLTRDRGHPHPRSLRRGRVRGVLRTGRERHRALLPDLRRPRRRAAAAGHGPRRPDDLVGPGAVPDAAPSAASSSSATTTATPGARRGSGAGSAARPWSGRSRAAAGDRRTRSRTWPGTRSACSTTSGWSPRTSRGSPWAG